MLTILFLSLTYQFVWVFWLYNRKNKNTQTFYLLYKDNQTNTGNNKYISYLHARHRWNMIYNDNQIHSYISFKFWQLMLFSPTHTQSQTKMLNHKVNRKTLNLTSLMHSPVLIINSTSSRTQYMFTYSTISIEKGTSKIESDIYTKSKTCDLLLPPFYSFFPVFYNNTTQNTMSLHFPISYSTQQPSGWRVILIYNSKFPRKLSRIMKSSTHRSVMPWHLPLLGTLPQNSTLAPPTPTSQPSHWLPNSNNQFSCTLIGQKGLHSIYHINYTAFIISHASWWQSLLVYQLNTAQFYCKWLVYLALTCI